MHFIYVIGAQCTGKTTLVEALAIWLSQNMPQVSVGILRETARTTLQLHQFTRDDIRPGGDRCLQLQRLIMESQEESECDMASRDVEIVISDRSGVDPTVYARMYCGDAAAEEMMSGDSWATLKSHMQNGTIILCEPFYRWLMDDGTRLMPLDNGEWDRMHEMFRTALDQQGLSCITLSKSMSSINERVKLVLRALKPMLPKQHESPEST